MLCKKRFVALSALGLLILGGSVARAEVRLPKIFTDNMMFQRDQPIRVWGWAEAGEEVHVTLASGKADTKADEKGQWAIELPALKAGENLELSIAGKNTIVLKNVIMGDIWLCSGQSNMEWGLGQSNAADDIQTADFPKIRRIKFNHVQSGNPEQDAPAATPWQMCTPQTAGGFTAVGFYFARDVQAKTGIPIGLLDDSWGGSKIEPWIASAGIELVPELSGAQGGNGWSGMYNAMIHPLTRFPIKGVLWYQGESNGGEGESYYHKMSALVLGWRKVWQQNEMPFYFVQLANFQGANDNPAGGDDWSKLREAQTKALLIPNTGMAVIIDTVPLNEAGDIHPKNKFDVGSRLARWSLSRDYGQKDMVVSGPLYKSLQVDGSKVRIAFDHIGSGLIVGAKQGRAAAVEDKEGKLKRFAIAGADKKWFWAEALIEKDTVVLSSAEVLEPVAVRYAYAMNPDGANLYNREGFPASPFRTDNWPLFDPKAEIVTVDKPDQENEKSGVDWERPTMKP